MFSRVFRNYPVIVANFQKLDREQADKLIIRLLEDSISKQEALRLRDWLQKDENVDYFNNFIEINHLINAKNEFDHRPSLLEVEELIKNRPTRNRYQFLKYAASIAIFLAVGYFFLVKN